MKNLYLVLILLICSTTVFAEESNKNISLYGGQFDITDQVGDDKTSLVGVEHRNPDLFRNTIIGKFSPVTGAFMTGEGAAYIYTGIEANYDLGPVIIKPGFAPGLYEPGSSGKEMGDILEFKSEISIGLDIFENSNIGYSYSHISNNDWGSVNPGSNNQTISFSQKF